MDTSSDAAAREGRYAALLGSAATLTTEELLDVIEDAQRDKDAASARQAVALAHLSALEPTRQEDGTEAEVHHGIGHQRLDAPELAAPRLGVSVHVATNRVADAIRQMSRTPAVVDAMAEGELDERRAAVVTEETDLLDAAEAAEVVDAVREHWGGLTVGPLRRFVARTVARLFPEAVADDAEKARERRGLTRVTGEHGTDQWRAELEVEKSRLAWSAVTERARQLVRDGHADSLTQARADAMTQLILEHSDVRVVLHATRPATDPSGQDAAPAVPTAAADADGRDGTNGTNGTNGVSGTNGASGWCEVGGLGAPGTTFVPARWLEGATTAGALTCHPVTGALLGGHVPAGLATGRDTSRTTPATATSPATTYRIPAAMARFVRLRDGGCRFPGCSTPARQCDLDHVRPWPTGPTDPSNLMALCRRHHRIKQRDGWTVRLRPDGTVVWTDPSGRSHTTSAVDHLHLGSTSTASPAASAYAPASADAAPCANTVRSSAPANGTAPAVSTGTARRTHHIDLSLLDEDLTELLAGAARGRRRTRRPDAMTEPLAMCVDHHPDNPWATVLLDIPPREPQPDVIPF
ncbi:HNH endonuclease [Knoellia locipacati]|uniref:HNH endonuclease signature motif containing protein n=1 Tax=Knoellia locipacati TaxID=882824 RepID=UPI00384BDE48